MPSSNFSGSLSAPKVNFGIDTGYPFLNATADGFLKIGAVAATRALAQETYHAVEKGNVSGQSAEHALKMMCKEGAYWGTTAGVYVGTESGIEAIRGTRDWKNALIAGSITGALVSAVSNKGTDKIVVDALTGGAVATASKFMNYLI